MKSLMMIAMLAALPQAALAGYECASSEINGQKIEIRVQEARVPRVFYKGPVVNGAPAVQIEMEQIESSTEMAPDGENFTTYKQGLRGAAEEFRLSISGSQLTRVSTGYQGYLRYRTGAGLRIAAPLHCVPRM